MAETGPTSYDGFLSYSHAADDLLAPRLQAGLQRFAKPWWKRRALRVFRDEASLSANPHLWSSITDALDDSDWFVLLLSPEAAESQWVNREIDYWREHKDPQKILPVVTDGTFRWSDGDVAGDAVPESLQGVFGEEPRWVDLRFARTETQLDLRHARFRDAVADIAAAVRGVAKDELESEEIRQHRRTIRTAWTAGVVILALGVAATVGAVVAVDQSNQAQTQRDEAQRERDRAVSAEQAATEDRDRAIAAEEEAERQQAIAEGERERAEEQADVARENAEEASRAAQEARARQLAAAALLNLDADPELSILLALAGTESASGADESVLQEPISALRQAMAASRVEMRIPANSFLEFVSYSPDGSFLATASGKDVGVWDLDADAQIHSLVSPNGRAASWAEFSADGGQLAVSYSSGDEPGPVVIMWDVATGTELRRFEGPSLFMTGNLAFSSDGMHLAAESAAGPLVVWDTETGVEKYRVDEGEGRWVGGPSFSPDGSYLAVTAGSSTSIRQNRVVLLDAATGSELKSFDPGELHPWRTAIDPTGRYLAAVSQTPASALIWDIESGELVSSIDVADASLALAWSPDGEILAVSGNEGIPRLYDVATGEEVLALLGQNSTCWSLAFSPDGTQLAGTGTSADTVIWDITPSGSREVATLTVPSPGLYQVAYDLDGDSILIVSRGMDGNLARLDADTGQVLDAIPGQVAEWPVGPIIVPEAGVFAGLNSSGEAALYDLKDFSLLSTVPEGGYVQALSRDGTRAVINPLEAGPFEGTVVETETWNTLVELGGGTYVAFSQDGDLVSVYNGGSGQGWLVQVSTGTVLVSFDVPDVPGYFSPDGSLLAVRTLDGRVQLLDVPALLRGTEPTEATVFKFTAHTGAVADARFSPDSSLLVTWGLIDQRLRVWDTTDGSLVADLGTTQATFSKFAFHPDGRHLVANDADTTLRIFTLDTDELVDIARSRITRSFTEGECATYHIDPCPDLESIRGG
jgi:WD40 repeat protein